MDKYLNKIHYLKTPCFFEILLQKSLCILSCGYYLGVLAWKFLYKINFLKKSKLPVYVISVGNLTSGGTGKTPISNEIARYIKKKFNKKVAILSHGYGGKLSTKGINLVSDGKNIYSTPYLVGDEPYWMATKSKGIAVLTGKNRAKTGKYAINNYGVEILVLDDAFQYIALERDLNILVVDCNKKFGNNMLLPAGPLREPISYAKRSDKIVIANKRPFDEDSNKTCNDFTRFIKEKFNKPTYSCAFKSGGIYNIITSEQLKFSEKAYAFAGIGQPEYFFESLINQDLNLMYTREFSDHHLYSKDDLENILKEAQNLGADAIITTEKDAVKLLAIIDEILLPQIPIYALELKVDIDLDSLVGVAIESYIKNEQNSGS